MPTPLSLRINQLIQACLHDALVGIGKPEPLREKLSGCWSRLIKGSIGGTAVSTPHAAPAGSHGDTH